MRSNTLDISLCFRLSEESKRDFVMISLPVLLPDGFSPVVSDGTPVTLGQLLAHKTISEHRINIPQQLAIPLAKVKHVLKKVPGDEVDVDEVIAVKKGFLGLDKAVIRSRVAGKVVRYERDTGDLVIQALASGLVQQVVSPVDGTITLCNNEKIVIQTDKEISLGEKGSGHKITGEVFILEESFLPERGEIFYHLDSRAKGKIVVAAHLSRDVMTKGISIGITGLIGAKIADADIEHIAQRDNSLPILEVNSDTINKLLQWNGKQIALDGKAKTLIFLHV